MKIIRITPPSVDWVVRAHISAPEDYSFHRFQFFQVYGDGAEVELQDDIIPTYEFPAEDNPVKIKIVAHYDNGKEEGQLTEEILIVP